jgi:sugar lactone lactonase YvrE
MKSNGTLTIALCLLASTYLVGQGQAPTLPPAPSNPPAPSLQAPNDPGYAALIATCKTPPPARGGRAGAGGGGAPGRPGGAPAGAPGGAGRGAQPQGPRDYKVTEIPGVIAAGQQWRFIWQEAGNNGDGIVGTDDGGLLLAQNDNSKVVKLDASGKTSVVYSDTHTGGALAMNSKGAVFLASRGLKTAIMQLAPRRQVMADSYQGDPLDCLGGVPNDLTADAKGGVYFTLGGVYYISPKGTVTKYGEVTPNGIILSADEKTLYVTNGPTLAAFDVQQDGSLTNQREFAKLEGGGNGDGSAIDAAGRIYVTTQPGVQVISADGKYLGIIPTPRNVISLAFGGKDKKTLFILARGAKDANGEEVANAAQVYSIQMIAQGYKGRLK